MTTTFGELEQRAGVRLLGEDVERGAGDLPALERLDERLLVDELAARDVDDAGRPSFMRAICSRPISPRVSGVSVGWSETKSASARRSSSVSARSTPSSRKRSGAT